MNDENPYASPMEEADPPAPAPARKPAVRTRSPLVPRYIAASIDGVICPLLLLAVGKSLPEGSGLLQLGTLVTVFLVYFCLSEWLFSRTPGKFLAGLVVRQTDGRPITWRQATVRNLMRLVEANPILLGALPAALAILFTRDRQRFGDMLAGTVVVSAGRR